MRHDAGPRHESRSGNALVMGAIAGTALAATLIFNSIHLNIAPTQTKGTVESDITAIDVARPSGYLAFIPESVIGRGDLTKSHALGLAKDESWAVLDLDTQIGLYYADMGKLAFDFMNTEGEEPHVQVSLLSDDGKTREGVNANDILLEPLLGSPCDTNFSGGDPIFTCTDVHPTPDNYEGRIDIQAHTSPLAKDPNVVMAAFRSALILARDKNCFEQNLQNHGASLQAVLYSTVRTFLWSTFQIPPSMVNFTPGPLSLNANVPASKAFDAAHMQFSDVVSPFDKKTPAASVDNWCTATVKDGFGNTHPFTDAKQLEAFSARAKALGSEVVARGIFPDDNGIGVINNPELDSKRRAEVPKELADKVIALS